MITDHRSTAKTVERGIKKILEGVETLNGGPLSYYMEKMLAYQDALFTRFAPFKPGDKVALKRTPKIEADSGWYSRRHFLVEGAMGEVHSIDYDAKRGFTCYVRFDVETWIDHTGTEQPVDDKALYFFDEAFIEKVEV